VGDLRFYGYSRENFSDIKVGFHHNQVRFILLKKECDSKFNIEGPKPVFEGKKEVILTFDIPSYCDVADVYVDEKFKGVQLKLKTVASVVTSDPWSIT